ncbi:tRNA lysidine(34) synthetase TilS [Candidatus Endowatersipora endosymbiont of Watersipora subatra]|uniref:tRNA lysidine(34) synthetase TilS n=1 Tax=Candidatus Endowatersipora endosymbiont of Watersipora subatra TaxID=3077946 RepID=UPI00312CA7FE
MFNSSLINDLNTLFSPVSSYKKIIAAVSGGSDSIALMFLLHEWLNQSPTGPHVNIVTIDHGLRKQSSQEVRWVRQTSLSLGFKHYTKIWENENKQKSAHSARSARYELLIQQAREVKASIILLGHTRNDQAETILMRSLRVNNQSGTLGLSGMSSKSSYEEISLYRPLLNYDRIDIRNYLKTQSQGWIDDPTNENRNYERVRARQALSTSSHFPSVKMIARFAELNNKTRLWMNRKICPFLEKNVWKTKSDSLIFSNSQSLPLAILVNCFSILIQLAGDQNYRPPERKVIAVAKSYKQGEKRKFSVGRCLITIRNSEVKFEFEHRRQLKVPQSREGKEISVRPLQRFRSQSDDLLYQYALRMIKKYDKLVSLKLE